MKVITRSIDTISMKKFYQRKIRNYKYKIDALQRQMNKKLQDHKFILKVESKQMRLMVEISILKKKINTMNLQSKNNDLS
jgi:hypothetical protein